ncbi:transcription repressor OFP14-like [Canna indica]|uniref:Transcription repressor n=1 Tax=Canna indica TaxID=4628 RepID=A0AAQ3KLK8_9LILI|nr:transcription repressor OFP14-like [Canna indica]
MGKKGLQKSLQIYLSKLKKVPSHLHIPNSSHPNKPVVAAANWRLLSACKYPQTPSFAEGRDRPDPAATLSDIDRFLHENFHSLYAPEDPAEDFSSESPRYDEDPPPDAFRSSERFFVSPDTSNSLLEEAQLPSAGSSRTSDAGPAAPGGRVAVTTFSKDPYHDFRRSMQDMVEEQHADRHQDLDWDFMEELLFCYLELNDRCLHRYILRAFADLTVSFRLRRQRTAPADEKVSRGSDKGAGKGRMAGPRHPPAVGLYQKK